MSQRQGQVARQIAGGIIAGVVGGFLSVVHAEIRLPKMLSAHAVLQRERPIHIWGWSEPGECVQVSFHAQAQRACATNLGEWSTYLQPEVAGGPYILTVISSTSGAQKVSVEDLLVGDVWFASGQSNMQMPLKGFGPDTPIKDSAKEIAESAHPHMRLLRFETKSSPYPLDDVAATWTECTPATAASFSAAAYFFGREISEKEQVPIGLIDSAWGGTPIESFISLETIAADAALMPLFTSRARFAENIVAAKAHIAAEKREDDEAKRTGKPAPYHMWHPEESSWNPSYIFNGMVAPATAYTIRGFLWYQGEANSDPERAPLYKREMPALIADWRARWGEGDLPFLYVQISSFESPHENWGEVRDAQRQALAMTKSAMVVSIDVGTPKNVHPPDKQTVGHRLALAGRALAYDEKLEWSGPLVREADRDGRSVRVWFDHADGLHANGAPHGFEIAGADGHFEPASATIDGKSILVSSDAVPLPHLLRYAWANVPDANLQNGVGLPASTFEALVKN